jgi:transcriptional regulator with XRE-family HTH domain
MYYERKVCVVDKNRMIFAERLAQLREEKNVAMIEISQATDIAQNTISQYENCLREPRLSMIIKLARYFDVSVNWLIGESDNRKG